MSRRIPKLFDKQFFMAALRMIVATGLMSIVTYFLVTTLDLQFEGQNLLMVLPKFVIISAVSLFVYLGISRAFKLSEAIPVVKIIKKLLFFRVKV